ncbi:MAG: hypothetical protein IBJ19_15425, partial [Gemmatimonadaceae bacterium]|nr:hypothetical protein [Gemmatimonadaceae bacterium]
MAKTQRTMRTVALLAGLALAEVLAMPQPLEAQTTTRSKARSSTTRTRARATTTRRAKAPVVPVLRHTTPRGAEALTGDLGTLLSSRTRNGEWGALVVSITRGDTLFSRGADSKLVPASPMNS